MSSLVITYEGAARAAANLRRYGRHVSGMWRVYERIAKAFRELEKHWFATRGEGSWPALSQQYQAWKAVVFPGKPILVRTGELKDSLTVSGVLYRNSKEILLGTDVDHAIYHQTGTENMPARPPVIPEEMLSAALPAELMRFLSYPTGAI